MNIGYDYAPYDDIIAMFGFIPFKKILIDTPEIHRFCWKTNKQFPDIFNYKYHMHRSHPYSKDVKLGIERVVDFFSWEIAKDPHVIQVGDCSHLEESGFFDDDKLKDIKEISGNFLERFGLPDNYGIKPRKL